MFSGIKRKDLLIKLFLQKHGQVKWNFSNLAPPPPSPPHTFLFLFSSLPQGSALVGSGLSKNPSLFYLPPQPVWHQWESKQFSAIYSACDPGHDGDSAEFLLLPPEPILPLSDWLCVEGLLSPITSPKPPHTHQAFGKQGHHS